MLRRATGFILAAVICLCLLPAGVFAQTNDWPGVGNSDLNILNGGIMLTDGDDFYFVENGIFVQTGDSVRAISADHARNLNLYDGYLYYTVGTEIRRVSVKGGASETLFSEKADIEQLYVVGDKYIYLCDGEVFERSGKNSSKISSISDIKGFIPTQYGNLYLTGEVFDYSLWADDREVLTGLESCYTDSGYLTVQMDNQNYMVQLDKLFNGFDKTSDLLDFDIHGDIAMLQLFDPDSENIISENNDNNELQLDFAALLEQAGLQSNDFSLMADEPSGEDITTLVPEVSEGQKNIVKRARQLTEIEWTPLEDIYQWGQQGYFKAETSYTGVPYGQPVNTNGYIGYGVSIEGFASAVLDNTSKLYTSYSNYNKIAPNFSSDCSGYVSYAWDYQTRKTTYSLPEVAEKVGDQSLYSLQVGDCLDKVSSHVVLVSELTYDESGSIIGVEIMEQTPVITRVTQYGNGGSRSLASLQSYYFNNGYVIYRNQYRDSVTYTPSPVVPLDGEIVAGQKEQAPKSHTTSFVGGKSVALSSDVAGAVIYYTLDGSKPTAGSTRYTGEITFYGTAKLRAIAVSGAYADSTILEYIVKVPQLETPTAAVSSGTYAGNIVSSGSKIKLSSVSGAKIYYTTDGSEPTSSSAVYSAPITITRNTTLKFMAQASGMTQSLTKTEVYTVGAVFNIAASAGVGGSISPSGSSSVLQTTSKTYSITPAEAYAIEDVLVDGYSQGAISSFTFTDVSANHTIEAKFKINAQIPFADVTADKWFYDSVSFVYAKKLFNGMSETSFAPDSTMTRGMFVTVLGRFAGLPSTLGSGIGLVTGTGVNIRKGPSTDTEIVGVVADKNTVVKVTSSSGEWYGVTHGEVSGYIRGDLIKVYNGAFTDLAAGQYYSPYAEWTSVSAIADGVASGSFAAESNITREHMCMLLYNYAIKYGKTLPKNVQKAAFSDDYSINSGAKTAVYALQQAGVINGMGDGTFAPQGTATRAQVAQIFRKFFEVVE